MSARPRSRSSARSASGLPWQPPAFAGEPWYCDPNDPRCLLDAKLECVDDDPAGRSLAVKLTTTAGTAITLRYTGVQRHTVPCYACDQGVGVWRRDEFEPAEDGRTLHRITWRSEATGGTTQWRIEAEAVACRAGPVQRRRQAGRRP